LECEYKEKPKAVQRLWMAWKAETNWRGVNGQARLMLPDEGHCNRRGRKSRRLGGSLFYGWWIVLAASFNFFFAVSIFYYGFPVF